MANAQHTCSVSGCQRAVVAKELCNAHYRRMKKGIDPHTDKTPLKTHGAICRVPDCGVKAYGLNLCSKHYHRMRNTGTTDLLNTAPGEATAFAEMASAFQGDECLMWPYSRASKTRRPTITYKGTSFVVTRLVCELAHGPAPFEGAHAAHSCGKGHLACVNQKHLRWATPTENAADKVLHGTAPRGRNNGHCKLHEADVRKVRGMISAGHTNKQIAKMFSVTDGAIRAIRTRRNWWWLE